MGLFSYEIGTQEDIYREVCEYAKMCVDYANYATDTSRPGYWYGRSEDYFYSMKGEAAELQLFLSLVPYKFASDDVDLNLWNMIGYLVRRASFLSDANIYYNKFVNEPKSNRRLKFFGGGGRICKKLADILHWRCRREAFSRLYGSKSLEAPSYEDYLNDE